jgi:N-acetylmuramic acid 6-phosphate etherase
MAMPPEAESAGSDRLVLGVDGGGSRCTAVLAAADPAGCHELGRGEGGPANAHAAGFETAAASVAAAIEEAFAVAGIPSTPLAAACLGLAGAGSETVASRWLTWARDRGLAASIEVMPDGLPAFGGDGEPPWGVLVIAGTGSVVWGRRPDGSLERCGGRGPLVGDEGSGFWLATQGLRAVIRMADGWGDETALLADACRRFAVDEVSDLPAALSAPATTRAAIAAFAADVVAAASAGDAVAGGILDEAATLLCQQAVTVGRRLGVTGGGYPLRLAGGLLCHAPAVRERLRDRLAAAGLPPATVACVPDLAAAAARMAAG